MVAFIKDDFNIGEDYLKHKELVKAVQAAVKMADPPFTIAINGAWGTGKTYLMRRAQKNFEVEYKTIWFDPWKYESEPNLLWPLLKLIKNKAPKLEHETMKTFKALCKCSLDVGLRVATAGALNIKDVEGQFDKNSMLDLFVDKVDFLERNFKLVTNHILEKEDKKKLIIFLARIIHKI